MSVLKLPYENELYELRKWIDNTNTPLNMQFLHTPQEIQRVRQWINTIAKEIQAEYPFYAAMLPSIANILFQENGTNPALVNPGAFGELAVIICHIETEPIVVGFWSAIHPQIVSVSRELYVDGHCSTAAEKAVKEVESRLREKFSELKPDAAAPSRIGDVIGALISENGAFKFCDTTTASGKDYRRGIQHLFEGIMAAYRNPSAHANLQYEKREAMEQIMLASQLMYVLDKPQL
ncbi:MAG: TIGR02391 family protein [Oscillospiraceae bacterium]